MSGVSLHTNIGSLADLYTFQSNEISPYQLRLDRQISEAEAEAARDGSISDASYSTLIEAHTSLQKTIRTAGGFIGLNLSSSLTPETRRSLQSIKAELGATNNSQIRRILALNPLMSTIRGASLTRRGIRVLAGASSTPTHLPSHTPVGLRNASNNCWLNSIMQFLMNQPNFFKHLIMKLPEDHAIRRFAMQYHRDRVLSRSTGEIVCSSANSQSIRQLLSRLSHEQISPDARRSEDAPEGLMILAGQLEPENIEDNPLFSKMRTTRVYDTTRITATLHGTPPADRELTLDGRSMRTTPEISFQLPMPFARSIQHEQILQSAWRVPGSMGENGRYHGVELPLREVRVDLEEAPEHFTCAYQRFKFTEQGRRIKNDSVIDIPFSYVLDPQFIIGDDAPYTLYMLQSFVVHSGGVNGGHYVSYTRKNDGTWWQENDSRVTPVSLEQAKNASKHAYLASFQKARELPPEEGRAHMERRVRLREPLAPAPVCRNLSPIAEIDAKIAALEAFNTELNTDGADHIAAFNALTPELQAFYAYHKWLDDSCPDGADYGRASILANPRCLSAITRPWMHFSGGSIIEQHISRLHAERRAHTGTKERVEFLHETLHTFQNFLLTPGLNQTMRKAHFDRLDDTLKETFAYNIWVARGKPSTDNFGNAELEREVRILTATRNKVIHPCAGNLLEQLSYELEDQIRGR